MMSAGSAATWAATLGASEIDGGGRPPAAGRVVAGGVAVLVAQVGQHRVEHFGGHRGARVVVQVDQGLVVVHSHRRITCCSNAILLQCQRRAGWCRVTLGAGSA